MANNTAKNTATNEQSRDHNTTAQAPNSGGPTGRTESSSLTAKGDRERPIESGRDSSRGQLSRSRGDASDLNTGRNPFTLMQRMADDMDRLFEQFGFGRMGLTPRFGSGFDDDLWSDRGMRALNTVWAPQVETLRRGDNLVIRADIPGVSKDDVHVEIENDILTISGERKEEHEDNRDGYYRSERSYGRFYRAIPLPEGIDADQCNASFKDGVLELTLPAPKQEERRAKRIQIR